MSLFDKLMQRFHSTEESTQANTGGEQQQEQQSTVVKPEIGVSYSESGYDDGYEDDDYEDDGETTEGDKSTTGEDNEDNGQKESDEAVGTDDADSTDQDEQIFKGEQEAPEFDTTVEQLESSITEYTQLVEQTIADGKLTAESVQAIEQEYAANGKLSEESYKALADAGFPKLFVDSYLRGQEAVSNSYVQSVISMAGGNEAFKQLCEYLATEGTLEAFQDAVENRNSSSIRAFMKMAESGLRAKYGRPAQRSVAQAAVPVAKPTSAQEAIKPFESRAEMMAAMNDPRYQRDASYNRLVMARLLKSNI
ncbi:capsid and scaffold protein [Providencia phage PSTRCR_120]|uniref:Capsid and scaffold protein n=1 Tax=Providencia phage PSTRCR_120 TaxID=2800826 RepID=A0A7T7CL16_9CAUD|nr:capsid and scaffold protein [Providencia phage PSTRCR_120]